MRTVELIREIASAMLEDPDSGYMKFEWKMQIKGIYRPCTDSWSDLLLMAEKPEVYIVRRRPRTIKVSGEVPEDMIKKAQRVVSAGNESCSADAYILARALLDLIEQSGGNDDAHV